MICLFHPDAQKEFHSAIDYYNERQEGLGSDFADEVFGAIQSILAFPNAWAPLSRNTRRCLINRFPYGIIYQVTEGKVIIIAIMQLNRKPGYWKNRESQADW